MLAKRSLRIGFPRGLPVGDVYFISRINISVYTHQTPRCIVQDYGRSTNWHACGKTVNIFYCKKFKQLAKATFVYTFLAIPNVQRGWGMLCAPHNEHVSAHFSTRF